MLQNPTPLEAKWLQESQWIVGMAKGPGWSLLKRWMEDLVSSCRDMCDNCESSDDRVIAGFALRLKLTRAITRDIINWVENTEVHQAKLLKELSEPDPERELQRLGDMFATEETDEYNTAAND